MNSKEILTEIAEKADIRINGDRPWDVRIHNEEAYDRILGQGTLGLGDAYMDGWWDCDRIDEMVYRAISAHLEEHLRHNLRTTLHTLALRFLNLQSIHRAPIVAEKHYNSDLAMFEAMLDPYMQYSCGYWKNATTLEEAQLAKMDLICRKLDLREGMTVLDIGSGWGGLSRYMAERYGVTVTGVNVSTEQVAYARKQAGNLPVEYLLEDYRKLTGQWDRIVSVGMFEHVGRSNYKEYFSVAAQCLKPDGFFLLHTIGSNGGQDSGSDPWLEKYIFPNGILPNPTSITENIEGLFILEDWHNFGADYDKTTMAWLHNFNEGLKNKAFECSERIHRMFTYYLCSCAGSFRCRSVQLWQLVLSQNGVAGGYPSVR